MGISTSGNSANVVRAFDQVRAMGMVTIGLTGEGGGKMAAVSTFCSTFHRARRRKSCRFTPAFTTTSASMWKSLAQRESLRRGSI